MLEIIIRLGDGSETKVKSDKNKIILGRSSDCDVVIPSDHVSRTHLEVIIEDGKIFVTDISTKNWVAYNDEKLSKEKPTLYFGFIKLEFPGEIGVFLRLVDLDVKTAPIDEKVTREEGSGLYKSSGKTNPRQLNELKEDPVSKNLLDQVKSMFEEMTAKQKEQAGYLGLAILIFVLLLVIPPKEEGGLDQVSPERKAQAKVKKKRRSRIKKRKVPVVSSAKVKVSKERQLKKLIRKLKLKKLIKSKQKCGERTTRDFCTYFYRGKSEDEGIVYHRSILYLAIDGGEYDEALGKFGKIPKPQRMTTLVFQKFFSPDFMKEILKQNIQKSVIYIFKKKGKKSVIQDVLYIDLTGFKYYAFEYKEAMKMIIDNDDLSSYAKYFEKTIYKQIR